MFLTSPDAVRVTGYVPPFWSEAETVNCSVLPKFAVWAPGTVIAGGGRTIPPPTVTSIVIVRVRDPLVPLTTIE